ncbi:MAG TPA: HAMP domain-containing sensor histidine kinase [Candidatus Hydrogenedentes bacterium]|nr:HAMP domain-containing sensor histidine kinase [Candidatus Hydrogenedentota bacterium]
MRHDGEGNSNGRPASGTSDFSCSVAPGGAEFDARLAALFRYAQVGRCVNGVAHDLNNYLGAVMAYAELCTLEEGLTSECNRMLGEIIGGIQKASALVNALTGVARKETTRIAMVDPSLVVRHVLELNAYTLKTARIPVETRIEENVPCVPGNAPNLELAISYLVLNAIEALDAMPDRRLFVGLCRGADAVEIAVKDSGPPIPEPLRERMFDPYVTTKPAPHLGLGLFVARAIVTRHAGTLHYAPETGFTITLPSKNGLVPE